MAKLFPVLLKLVFLTLLTVTLVSARRYTTVQGMRSTISGYPWYINISGLNSTEIELFNGYGYSCTSSECKLITGTPDAGSYHGIDNIGQANRVVNLLGHEIVNVVIGDQFIIYTMQAE